MDTKARLDEIVSKAGCGTGSKVIITDNKAFPCPFSGKYGMVRVEISDQQITKDNTSKSIEIQWFSPKQTRVERLEARHNIVGNWENLVFLEAGRILECEASDDAQYEFDYRLFDQVEKLL